MQTIGRGRIVLWHGGSLWLFDVTPTETRAATDLHAHHAIQITFSLGGQFNFTSPSGRMDGPGVAVAPDAEHVFAAVGPIGLLFIEPESRAGRAVQQSLLGEHALVRFDPAILGPARDELTAFQSMDDAALRDTGQRLLSALAGGLEPDIIDWRLRKIVKWATDHLDAPITAAAAAEQVGLSATRFSHLFVEQTGLPFRTYVLWLRLTRAVELFAAGQPLTEAAHAAGFSDSAHFSRTFHRMFGLPATTLQVR
jgi:AraC family transcriptional regulator